MVKYFLKIENFVQYIEDHHSKTAPIYYMLISSLLHATNTMLSKQIPRVPTEELVFIRAIVMLSINSAFINS